MKLVIDNLDCFLPFEKGSISSAGESPLLCVGIRVVLERNLGVRRSAKRGAYFCRVNTGGGLLDWIYDSEVCILKSGIGCALSPIDSNLLNSAFTSSAPQFSGWATLYLVYNSDFAFSFGSGLIPFSG
jgi:hypothetical protein